MKKERIIWITIIILLLVCMGVLIGYRDIYSPIEKQNASDASQNIPKTDVVIMKEQPVTLQEKYIGTVVPIHSVQVLPYISGFIDKVLVKGGATVHAGDVLFILEQQQYAAQKKVAEANVESARASLNNARIYLERIERTKSKAISQTELDNARTSFLSAQASLKASEAQLKVAKVNYDYTVIRAPIDGILGNIPVTKGSYVSPNGEALARIIQQSPIRVVFTMSNRDYLKGNDIRDDWLRSGVFRLKLPDGKIYAETGTFQYADNQITEQTSGILIYLDFLNPKGQLIANSYVEVFWEKTLDKAILADKNLIHLNEKGAFAYVVENERIKEKKVVLGMSIGNQYVIESGLKAGDAVILGTVPPSLIGKEAEAKTISSGNLNKKLMNEGKKE